jgi:hypothetical protein
MKPVPATKTSRRGRRHALAALLLVAGLLAPTVLAQHRHGPEQRGPSRQWHGDIARFHGYDRGTWRGGHWQHARHGGRFGWWWVVGPAWYFYPAPVYPYPSPWLPADVIGLAPYGPPLPPAQYWYYCGPANAYYPYVASCPVGWTLVPAAPVAGIPP